MIRTRTAGVVGAMIPCRLCCRMPVRAPHRGVGSLAPASH
jgi:hypothetical protein